MKTATVVRRSRTGGGWRALSTALSIYLSFSHLPRSGPPTPLRRRLPVPLRVPANHSFVSSRSRRARASVFRRRFARAARKTSSAAHRARIYNNILFSRPAGTRAPTAAAAENDGRSDACVVPSARGTGGGARCGVCVRAVCRVVGVET